MWRRFIGLGDLGYGVWMTDHSLRRDAAWLEGLVCAVLGAVAFSGKAIVAKLMYKLGADPFAVVGLRMTMAFPMFLLMAWWAGRPDRRGAVQAMDTLSRGQCWQIVGLGFCGYYLASTLDFVGLQYISASLERAILYLNPTIVLLLSAFFLKQRIRAAQVAAVLLSYGGVLIVWLHDWDAAAMVSSAPYGLDGIQAITLGSLCVFLSAVSYAVYLMGSGQLVQQIGSSRLVGWASCAACAMCVAQWVLVYGGTEGRMGGVAHLPWQAWALSAINATACTVLPVWLVMRGVQLVGAAVASQVGMVGPLSTIWMAAGVLGEPVTGRLMLGTAAVLAGIVVLTRAGQAGKPQPAAVQAPSRKA